MKTVYGILTDAVGLAANETRSWATPSINVRSVQDPRIPIDENHDGRTVGEVIDLQHHHGNLWCVAEVHDTVASSVRVRVGLETRSVAHDLFWSASRIGTDEDGYVFTSVSLTPSPARVAARPIVFLPGDTHQAARASSHPFERELLARAAEARLKRHGGPIVIRDPSPFEGRDLNHLSDVERLMLFEQQHDNRERQARDQRPYGPIRHGAVVRGSVLRIS